MIINSDPHPTLTCSDGWQSPCQFHEGRVEFESKPESLPDKLWISQDSNEKTVLPLQHNHVQLGDGQIGVVHTVLTHHMEQRLNMYKE